MIQRSMKTKDHILVEGPTAVHVDSAVLQPAVLYAWYTQVYLIQIRKLPQNLHSTAVGPTKDTWCHLIRINMVLGFHTTLYH